MISQKKIKNNKKKKTIKMKKDAMTKKTKKRKSVAQEVTPYVRVVGAVVPLEVEASIGAYVRRHGAAETSRVLAVDVVVEGAEAVTQQPLVDEQQVGLAHEVVRRPLRVTAQPRLDVRRTDRHLAQSVTRRLVGHHACARACV